MRSSRQLLVGAAVAIGGITLLSALMVPLRGHVSVATPALVLVVPVVAGVAVGGWRAGLVAVVAGFLAYDLVFLAPYGTLSVGAGQDWVALGVYVAAMLVVARVVAFLQKARLDARRHEEHTRRLYAVSDLLIGDRPMEDLFRRIVQTVEQAFEPRWCALLVAEDDALRVVATSGAQLTEDELGDLSLPPGRRQSLGGGTGDVRVAHHVLIASSRPVGLLALADAPLDPHDWELLRTFANQAALAIERERLREQVVRTELLEEVDRWRDALVGAVSHDLRTPLSTIKTAVSTLRGTDIPLSPEDHDELLGLIDTQSDALDRLVRNLLDMTRIQSGTLELRRTIVPIAEIVDSAHHALDAESYAAVKVDLPVDLPPVDVDQTLLVQVLVNLLENAVRHSPPGEPVEVSAVATGDAVEVAVRDHGPGVPREERDRLFLMLNRVSGSGRAGLGLAISKSFVEAHGQTIRADNAPDGGALFRFTMPRARALPFDTG